MPLSPCSCGYRIGNLVHIRSHDEGTACTWFNCGLPEGHTQVLSPGTYEWDFIWKQGLCRHNQDVEIRFFWIGLTVNGWCAFKKKQRESRDRRDRQMEEEVLKRQRQRLELYSHKSRNSKSCNSHQKLRKRNRIHAPSLQNPVDSLGLALLASRIVK